MKRVRDTGGIRALGPGPRLTTLAVLLASAVTLGFCGPDPIGAALFAGLLLLPRDYPPFSLFRKWNPTVSSGLIGLCLLLPLPDMLYVSHHAGLAFAHLAALLAVWRFKQERLTISDHYSLLGASLFIVIMGLTGSAGKSVTLLLLYGLAALIALHRLHLAGEENRVLDLARVQGWLRDEAEEVAGRGGTSVPPGSLALWVLVGGLLIAWLAPRAEQGVAVAWNWVFHGETKARAEEPSPLPEVKDAVPRFEIPPGVTGPLPFGERLDRDEYVFRMEEQDDLALLLRRPDGEEEPTHLRIRGECYDYLTSGGRWIRARDGETVIPDGRDGHADGVVTLASASAEETVTREVLTPGRPGRTIYAVPPIASIVRPRVAEDGTGNFAFPVDDPTRRVFVVSDERPLEPDVAVRDAGPEYLLLPAGLDREKVRELFRPALMSAETDRERIVALGRWLAKRCVCFEGDRPPAGATGTPPKHFDPMGFLVDRRWGRNVDFATAFAVLLRAAGIPCRLATGFLGGAQVTGAGFLVFRSRHSRAWVEVPFAGRGWIPFDPTPSPVNSLADSAIQKIFTAPPEQRSMVAEREFDAANRKGLLRRILDAIDARISGLLPGSPGTSVTGRLLAWIVVLLGLGLFSWLLTRGFEKGAGFLGRGRGRREADARAVAFYERLLRVLSRNGMRRRKSQTPVEFARTVVDRCGPEFTDVSRLTNAFCAHRYGFRRIPDPQMQDYLARVGRLEALLKNGRGRAVPAPARSPARVTGVLLLVLLLGASGPVAGQERPPAAPAAPPAKALVRDLGDPEPRVRAGAEAALLAAGRAAVPLLLAEIAPHVAEPESARLETLIEQLDSPDYATREAATRALIEMGGDAVPALERVAKEGSPEASHRARYALGEIAKHKEAAGPRDDPRLRGREAMYLLGRLGEAGDVEAIVAATLSEDGYPDEGLRALAGIERRARNSLQPLLSRPDRSVRLLAIRALALAGVEPARPLLLPLAFDPDSGIRTAVRRALLTPELVETIDRARMQLEQKEFEKAEAELTRVLRLCPGEPHAGRLLALRRLASGRAKEGLEIAEGLSLPEAEREMLCARMLAATGDREAARARLMDAARAAPADPEPLIRAAELDGKANPPRIGAAVQALEEAAKRAPVDARVWARLGAVYGEGARDRTNAVRCYRRALDLDPGNGDYLKALVRYR